MTTINSRLLEVIKQEIGTEIDVLELVDVFKASSRAELQQAITFLLARKGIKVSYKR